MKLKLIGLWLPLLLVISGCSTVQPGKRFGNASLESLKTAFVVYAPGAQPEIGDYIKEALAKRGVDATTGYVFERDKSKDFYITYTEKRVWDLKMYLDSLDIEFHDTTTDQLIASGSFRNSVMHSYPDERKKTFEVIDSMYKAK